MLMDLFILPRNRLFNEEKAKRTIASSLKVVHNYYEARSFVQINKTPKNSLYYAVAYDNEWFDPRLVIDLQTVLLYSRGIDMFSVFTAEGDGNVVYQPRVFRKELQLNPDIVNQPLPYDHEKLKFEKLIGGWLYID